MVITGVGTPNAQHLVPDLVAAYATPPAPYTLYWTGAVDSNWSTPGNWSMVDPLSGTAAVSAALSEVDPATNSTLPLSADATSPSDSLLSPGLSAYSQPVVDATKMLRLVTSVNLLMSAPVLRDFARRAYLEIWTPTDLRWQRHRADE